MKTTSTFTLFALPALLLSSCSQLSGTSSTAATNSQTSSSSNAASLKSTAGSSTKARTLSETIPGESYVVQAPRNAALETVKAARGWRHAMGDEQPHITAELKWSVTIDDQRKVWLQVEGSGTRTDTLTNGSGIHLAVHANERILLGNYGHFTRVAIDPQSNDATGSWRGEGSDPSGFTLDQRRGGGAKKTAVKSVKFYRGNDEANGATFTIETAPITLQVGGQ